MSPRTKWLLIGVAIGAALGVAATFLLLRAGIFRPMLVRPGNFTGNFTRPFRGSP